MADNQAYIILGRNVMLRSMVTRKRIKNINDHCCAALTQEYQPQGTVSNFAAIAIPPPVLLPLASQDTKILQYPCGTPYSMCGQMETAKDFSGAFTKHCVQSPRDINPRPNHKRKNREYE
jgi:hypothetical protein